MGLLRSVPLKNSSTDLPFLKEVDFETLRLQLAARDLTQPTKAASKGGGPAQEANHNPGSHLPHFIGMPENRRKLQGILNSSRKNNVWVIGSKGIGKTTLVEDYIREKARGRVDAELATKPVFIFDVNDFFAQPREKWVGLYEDAWKHVAGQKGQLITDHIDDFVKTADGEAGRLMSVHIKFLERAEDVQSLIVSEPAGETAIEQSSSGVTRRFQKLRLNKEPDDATLKSILISHFKILEQVHGVNFCEDTADEMIRLLRRYPGRAFTGVQPASALDFADAVANYVWANQFALPPEILEIDEKLGLLEDRMAILATDGEKAKPQREALQQEMEKFTAQRNMAHAEFDKKFGPLAEAKRRFEDVDRKIAVYKEKKNRTPAEEQAFSRLTSIHDHARKDVEDAEKALHAEAPLVEAKHVRAAFGLAANLPLSKLHEDKRARLAKLPAYLDSQIFLQDRAKSALARIYRQRERGTSDPSRPAGVLLFAGDTGLGKTELAKSLVRFDLGLEDRPELADQIEPITVELSQFQSASSVAKITGADPGLIGYDDPVKLLEDVRNNPRGIVLLDEADKAHPALFDLLMQVLENGKLTDSHGHDVIFKDTIIIICINGITAKSFDFDRANMDDDATVRDKVKDVLSQSKEAMGLKLFRPEFINRIDDVVIFEPMGVTELQRILQKEIRKINSNYRDAGISVEADEATRTAIVEHWPIPASGGRAPRQIAQKYIRPVLDICQDEREDSSVGKEEALPPEHFELRLDGEKIRLEKIGEFCPLPRNDTAGAGRTGAAKAQQFTSVG
jgi:ATP-dependent Clp protease ATP-binding subunit ClpB